jgi:hypothetical protein
MMGSLFFYLMIGSFTSSFSYPIFLTRFWVLSFSYHLLGTYFQACHFSFTHRGKPGEVDIYSKPENILESGGQKCM